MELDTGIGRSGLRSALVAAHVVARGRRSGAGGGVPWCCFGFGFVRFGRKADAPKWGIPPKQRRFSKKRNLRLRRPGASGSVDAPLLQRRRLFADLGAAKAAGRGGGEPRGGAEGRRPLRGEGVGGGWPIRRVAEVFGGKTSYQTPGILM